jgi:Rad3-related DNA helicase
MTNNTKEMFGELLLDKKIVAALTAMGFEEPSPIQRETIPIVLEGNDLIGQAQTGTGKTAAFGIPIVQNITDHKHIQALIMTPTRELAIQVAEEVGKIGQTRRIKALRFMAASQSIGKSRLCAAASKSLSVLRADCSTIFAVPRSSLTQSDSLLWTRLMKCWTWVLWKTWKKS